MPGPESKTAGGLSAAKDSRLFFCVKAFENSIKMPDSIGEAAGRQHAVAPAHLHGNMMAHLLRGHGLRPVLRKHFFRLLFPTGGSSGFSKPHFLFLLFKFFLPAAAEDCGKGAVSRPLPEGGILLMREFLSAGPWFPTASAG